MLGLGVKTPSGAGWPVVAESARGCGRCGRVRGWWLASPDDLSCGLDAAGGVCFETIGESVAAYTIAVRMFHASLYTEAAGANTLVDLSRCGILVVCLFAKRNEADLSTFRISKSYAFGHEGLATAIVGSIE